VDFVVPDVKQYTANTYLEREKRIIDFMISQLKSWSLSGKAASEAISLIRDMADDGNVHAQYHLGRYAMLNADKIRLGEGLYADDMAKHYLSLATGQGHKAAQLQLAIFYQKQGEYDKLPGLLKALVIRKQAPVPMRVRAACFLRGHGVSPNRKMAERFFELAHMQDLAQSNARSKARRQTVKNFFNKFTRKNPEP